MELKKIKSAHMIGIGGIAMSAVAKILLSKKISVSGSDLKTNSNVENLIKLGAKITIGEHTADNLEKNADVVIYSSAVPVTNAERQKADTLKIQSFDYHDFLGILTKDVNNIVITGTHGKTTTTAMTGLIFEQAKKNPTVVVGSNIKEFNGNARVGSAELNIIEGDEYKKGILALDPSAVILTNIEYDHPDIFPTQSDYIELFQDFINKLPEDGLLIYNLDDHTSVEHLIKPHCRVATFSLTDQRANLFTKNLKSAHGRQIFRPVYNGNELKDFNIKLPGKYNVSNALAAALAALELGINQDAIKDALAVYGGAGRRFELIGNLNGAIVVSDYAHHPTALEAVIKAAKDFYPDRHLTVWFQPHQKNRTRNLLNDFTRVIDRTVADKFYLNEIYDVPGRSEEETVSSNDIIKKLKRKDVSYIETLEEGLKIMQKKIKEGDVLLVVGAGDIDSAIRTIIS